MFTVHVMLAAGGLPVLASSGGSGARNRYLLGSQRDEPSELSHRQLQTVIARVFEIPGVIEVVVRQSERG